MPTQPNYNDDQEGRSVSPHSDATSIEPPLSSKTYAPQAHHNVFFWRWAEWIVDHRWSTIALSIIMMTCSVLLILPAERLPSSISQARLQLTGHPGLLVDTSVEAFSNPEDHTQAILERYRDQFGRDDFFILLVEGEVFSLPFLERLKALHERLESLNIEVKSLGERKIDRLKKTKGEAFTQRLVQRIQASKTHQSASTGHDDALDEGGFDEEGFGEEDGDDGWGDEEGGTVIEEVSSLINARKTTGTTEGIDVGEWCDPMPRAETLDAFKRAVLADETLVGQVVGRRGRHAVISIRAHFMSEADTIRVNVAIKEIARELEAPDGSFKVHSSGLPELNSTLKVSILSTLRVLLIISILLMISVLTFQFRHWIAVLSPMVVVALAAQNTFALMSLLGMPVTMLSNILPAFIFCVGIGDSVHLLSVYRDHFKTHHDTRRAIIETVAMTGTPVLFTSLTTIVGLLSFRFASIPAIQDMGTAGAFGIAAACFHSLFFLPAVLTFNKKSSFGLTSVESERKVDRIDRMIDLLADSRAGLDDHGGPRPESISERRRRVSTLWLGALMTLIACIGVSQLRVWHNPLSWLPKDNPTKASFQMMDDEVSGTANIQLLITGGALGLKDIELLKGVEALEKHIKAYRHPTEGDIIGNSININDVIMETRRALHQGDLSAYRLPDDPEELAQLLFLFENTGPDQLRRLATNDLNESQMTIRLKWLEATSYLGLTEHISRGIKKYIPPHAQIEPTGSVYTLVSTVGALLLDLIRSFGAALIVITLIMIFLLRSFKLGFISMIPNLIPILWLMGMMGFLEMPIDMNNILIASIAIGLAVDDTIHLLHHYRIFYEESADPFLAIHHSLKHAGRAMVSTSLILSLGFFAYLGSDMKNIQTFGLLIGLSALVAMLVDLIFAPAFLRTFYSRLKTT
jgi:uncharacterized protein